MKMTLSLILALSVSTTAWAQDVTKEKGNRSPEQLGKAIKALDKDGDGKITKAEAGNAPWFDNIDQNKDGVLDAAELDRLRKSGGGSAGAQFLEVLKKADKDGDGKITKAEAENAPWFARLDQNKDGVVDAKEMEQVRKATGAAGMTTKTGADGGQFEALLKRADKNNDGKITKEEAGDAPWFERVDQNKDGVLDAAELEKLRNARKQSEKS